MITPYLALMLGLLLVAFCLACLGLLMQKPGTVRPTRPLPYPEHPPEYAEYAKGRTEMAREGRHHRDDLEGSTVNLAPRMEKIYGDPR